MNVKTTDGRRLKRLARAYARAVADVALEKVDPSGQWDWDTHTARDVARDKLFAEIDRLTSVDLTPRAVSGDY